MKRKVKELNGCSNFFDSTFVLTKKLSPPKFKFQFGEKVTVKEVKNLTGFIVSRSQHITGRISYLVDFGMTGLVYNASERSVKKFKN